MKLNTKQARRLEELARASREGSPVEPKTEATFRIRCGNSLATGSPKSATLLKRSGRNWEVVGTFGSYSEASNAAKAARK